MNSQPQQKLEYTSHVGRDVLSSAAAFKTDAAVVWEYVVNSLQYVDPGIFPRLQIQVHPQKKIIEIHDNGRGMDESMLRHFFMQHGENLDRKSGRGGRGKFGTGKSAAFGIANRLVIDTRRANVRNRVEVIRSDIEQSDGSSIPLQWVVQNEPCDEPNGTTITISEIFAPRIRTQNIIEYIERHLQVWRHASPKVAVNDHVCVYREPDIAKSYEFVASGAVAEAIGNGPLTVNVSRTPLEQLDRGVAVSSGEGNLVAREHAGVCEKEHGSYIFGEINVPNLENSSSPIEPYDDSRSLQLNPEHPVASALIGFIGSKLEYVRKEIAKEQAEAKKSEEARRLSEAADRIAEALNEDFRRVKERLEEIRAAASRSGAATSMFGAGKAAADDLDAWIAGTDEPGEVETSPPDNSDTPEPSPEPVPPKPAPDIPATGRPEESADKSVSPAGGTGKRRKPKGGFQVGYAHLGSEERRSVYDEGAMKILINLDNVVIDAALRQGGIQDMGFRRLSYEVAFSEYAMALGYEMAGQDPDIPADDLLYEVRHALTRVSESAVALYTA